MVTTGNSYNLQHWVKDVLAEASVSLSIINHHLLEYLFWCDATKAARFCPCLINYAVSCHSVCWERTICAKYIPIRAMWSYFRKLFSSSEDRYKNLPDPMLLIWPVAPRSLQWSFAALSSSSLHLNTVIGFWERRNSIASTNAIGPSSVLIAVQPSSDV